MRKSGVVGLGLVLLAGISSAYGVEPKVPKGTVKKAVREIEERSNSQYGQQSGDAASCERVATKESREEGQSVGEGHRPTTAGSAK